MSPRVPKPLWLQLADLCGWHIACRVARTLREDARDGESILRDYEETLQAILQTCILQEHTNPKVSM